MPSYQRGTQRIPAEAAKDPLEEIVSLIDRTVTALVGLYNLVSRTSAQND